MKKLGLLTVLALSVIATTSLAETISSVGAAYMTRANLTGPDVTFREKAEAVVRFANTTSAVKVELMRVELRIQNEDPNGKWINKLFLSTTDKVNNYYFNLTDRKITAIKSMKANEKNPTALDIVVEAENGIEVTYVATLLPTPREDLPAESKVFHVIRLTDSSPVPSLTKLIQQADVVPATTVRESAGRTAGQLPLTRTGKNP